MHSCRLSVADSPRLHGPLSAYPSLRHDEETVSDILVTTDFVQGLMLALALYTPSTPDLCLEYNPGYRVLSRLIPRSDIKPHLFYPSFGAFLVVFLVSYNSPEGFFNRYILISSVA